MTPDDRSVDTNTAATADDASLNTITTTTPPVNLKNLEAEELAIGRDELKNVLGLLQFVAGISAVGILNPPGGLDSNGLARFRKTAAYHVFFSFADLAFLSAVFSCVYISSRTPRDVGRCRVLIRRGWYFLAGSSCLLLGAFLAGVFIIVPVKECVNKVCVSSILPWVALVAAIVKIVSSIGAKWTA